MATHSGAGSIMTDVHLHITERVQTLFGIKRVHDWQYKVCDAILALNNCLLSVPTSGGKTLSFYLPLLAHWAPGENATSKQKAVLIVSPLVELMKEQRSHGNKASALNRAGIAAVAMCSETMNEGDVLRYTLQTSQKINI
ncbi:hypothetical protein K439DRAFT_1542604 [Ramaria rubella]|nr:hypothetical protein K439DRAFT_1542604 [Ramaria rubella]